MPIIAIGAAIIADVGVGAAGFGAVLAGTASLGTTLAVVGAVGATLGAVGAVTGVKGLQTAGMILGGIGGIGSLAASAGLFGDSASAATSSLFGDTSDVATQAAADSTSAANLIADSTGATAGLGAVTSSGLPDIINTLNPPSDAFTGATTPITGQTPPPVSSDLVSSDTSTGSNFGSQAQDAGAGPPLPSGSPTTTGIINTSAAPPPSAIIAGGTPGNPVTAPGAPGAAAPVTPAAPQVAAGNVDIEGNPVASSPGILGGIMNFASKNPLMSYGLVQAAGSFLSGATNPLTPAQVDALDAQAAVNNQAANLSKTQQANMAQALPVASRTPSPVTGLINQPQGAITGQAA